MKKQTVWVTHGQSESGDFYGPFVFDQKPTEDDLRRFWQDVCAGGDYDPDSPGPGDYDTYVHVSTCKAKVIPSKKSKKETP